jgi:hypothetical protein
MQVKKRAQSPSSKVRLLLPVVIAMVLGVGALVFAEPGVPHSSPGKHTGTATTGNKTNKEKAPVLKEIATSTPSPTPTGTPQTVQANNPSSQADSQAAAPPSDSSQPSDCPTLQAQWAETLSQAKSKERWQLDQNLLSMLLSTKQHNAAIDLYNNTLQTLYGSLATQAKSAQCNLGLSAPALYPHIK